jgi:UDP:flavonoid glycosyltransferase YjiC (YdhE family)
LIFPRCQAVVHHGGAGTTQSATLAGRPSVVVAHISEQEHWGRELQRMGVAGGISKRRSLTARQLAGRLRLVQDTPEMTTRAEAIARAIALEDGVAQAVRHINERFGCD